MNPQSSEDKAPERRIWTGKYTAEFNTGLFSLQQLAQMEMGIDITYLEAMAEIRTTKNTTRLSTLMDLIEVYYDRLWATMYEVKQKEAEAKWARLEANYFRWIRSGNKQVPMEIIQEIKAFKRYLYEFKQKIVNLGIPMRKETSAMQRLKKALE